MSDISALIASELDVREAQVTAAINLLDGGATVPFIARYRKELTGALDDAQLRRLDERLTYLRELAERRETVLNTIDQQGQLTPELKQQICAVTTKTELEDLYLPYKPKRRTKAQIAREAGLEPLAEMLFDNLMLDPEHEAQAFIDTDKGIIDSKQALDGAKQILMERFSEDAALMAKLRTQMRDISFVHATVVEEKQTQAAKFRDYFDHREAFTKIPSHRALAMFRGRNEGLLNLAFTLQQDLEPGQAHPCEVQLAAHWDISDSGRPADPWLAEVLRWTWRVKLATRLETDLLAELREAAEADAIEVFASNLKDLLLAAPAGQKATIGLDPGLRTGVKVAVVDATGKVLDHTAIFPNPPQNKVHEAQRSLIALIEKYDVQLIAIGNGTASRETEKFVAELLSANSLLSVQKVIVSEAGASVYSASEFAAREFPDLDVTIRGAISIARRLQDPLAELVKIEPKSIGVGQYQHDVSQTRLARALDAVVEDCVNAVGVEVNTASAALLTRVAGLNQNIAHNIVEFRNKNGVFQNRKQLLDVSRLGAKAFEQAAGFLRISDGDNPLDASAVHPEAYDVVSAIAKKNGRDVKAMLGDKAFLGKLQPGDYVDQNVGLPTLIDILAELEKPGRDPRPEFKAARFSEGVEKISDLAEGMVLEGAVTNVTNFGAFVDVGVHQDGLVHISALANHFVKDPRAVVKAGDIVKVKVMDVDVARKRIALSMRMDDAPVNSKRKESPAAKQASSHKNQRAPKGTMASLLEAALNKAGE